MGDPQNGCFTVKNPIQMDDKWGTPYFRKPPYVLTHIDVGILYGSNIGHKTIGVNKTE